MISLLFFSFVGLVLVAGFIIAMIIRRKKRNKMQDREGLHLTKKRKTGAGPYSHSAFNETPAGNLKGGALPAGSKRSQNDPNSHNEQDKDGNPSAF